MKITTKELENIIKEEVQNVLEKNILGRFLDDEETGMDFGLDGFDSKAYAKQIVDHWGNGGGGGMTDRNLPVGALGTDRMARMLKKFFLYSDSQLRKIGDADVLPNAFSRDANDFRDYLLGDEQFINGTLAAIINWGPQVKQDISLPKRLVSRLRDISPKGKDITIQDIKSSGILDEQPDLMNIVRGMAEATAEAYLRGQTESRDAARTKAARLYRHYRDFLDNVELLNNEYRETRQSGDGSRSKYWEKIKDMRYMPDKKDASRIAKEFEETSIQDYEAGVDGLNHIPARLKYFVDNHWEIQSRFRLKD